jgi:nucleoid-associated protein YgaU
MCGPGCSKINPAAVENSERGSALYRQAFSAEQSGDIKEAIRLFNKVLIEEPRSYSAHFQLATLLHDHDEDYTGAIYHYKQYLYLRPESEKSTLAQERIRIAEQLLAPQILKKVGDSVQGISQAHLLKENERLNRVITTMEGEKAVLMEGKAAADKELVDLRGDNTRLRDVLNKMRISETVSEPSQPILKRVEAAMKKGEADKPAPKLDAQSLRAMREEASAMARDGSREPERKPLVDVPSTDAMIKKVQSRLEGSPKAAAEKAKPEAAAEKTKPKPAAEKENPEAAAEKANPEAPAEKVKPEVPDNPVKLGKSTFSALSLFGKEDKREKGAKPRSEARTYVVQPGDSLFRVAEKFYGDSMQWKKIRDANPSRIDPDGRIRAGQIIVVP